MHFCLTSLAPGLIEMRARVADGRLSDMLEFRPGLTLRADPALGVDGHWRSPAGRLLELDVTTQGPGAWIGLHVALNPEDLRHAAWIGFTCRSAAPEEVMIRPCLRSGTGEGFSDVFFDKHMLADPEPRNHVDAIHLPTTRTLPDAAPWRELVLFLPRKAFRWHLHDLRPFVV